MEEKISTFLTNIEFEGFDNNAVAAFNTKTPYLKFAKFILADDVRNGNRQRIPQEEFANLIDSGIFMPIKMKKGKEDEGHKDAEPLGVITHLKQEDNKIIGLAGLWVLEREEDVAYLKEKADNGVYPQLSWEIRYADTKLEDDGNTEVLLGTKLRAVTVVGLPAYQGRTPMLAISSQQNSNLEAEKVEELEKTKAELSAKIAELDTAKAEIASKDEDYKKLESELEELREFKAEIEKEKANADKISSVVDKFKEAGIEKDEDYFESNRERFLAMSEEDLDFFIQELVAFASNQSEASDKSKTEIPNIKNKNGGEMTPKQLAQALRELSMQK